MLLDGHYSKIGCKDINDESTCTGEQCAIYYYNPDFVPATDYQGCLKTSGARGKSSKGSGGKIYEVRHHCSYDFDLNGVYPDNRPVTRKLIEVCKKRDGRTRKDGCHLRIYD